jgi:peroxin-12
MAFVNLGGDDSKPTYFEVLAADRLVPGLRAAVVYALSVLSQRRSWLHRLLAYEDELLAVLMLAVDWHTLGAADATFAESLYGLRRVPLLAHQPHNKQQPPPQPLRLTRRQKLLALAAEVSGKLKCMAASAAANSDSSSIASR